MTIRTVITLFAVSHVFLTTEAVRSEGAEESADATRKAGHQSGDRVSSNRAVDVGDAVRVLQPFSIGASDGDVLTVNFDAAPVRLAAGRPGKVTIQAFPLRTDLAVELAVEPFRVAGPRTRVVLGRKGQPDEPIDFDPTTISFFRGEVPGRAGSHVFLAFSERLSTGFVDLGPGAERYGISTKDRAGQPLPAGQLSIFQMHGDGSVPPGVPLCGLDTGQAVLSELLPSVNPATDGSVAGTLPRVNLQHLELAVETDFEYFALFGNVPDATTYVFMMYGAVSDIYMRDVDTRVEVVFVRIWNQPNDIANGGDPLGEFQDEWDANMGGVARDNAQFFSGRRNFAFGGIAYLASLCSTFGYGAVGYAQGFFPDPSRPSPYAWDIGVSAHELGHSCNARHTHDHGLDTCDNPNTTPRRGSIMSYCSQTWSGMNSNDDEFFHTRNRVDMRNHIFSRTCIADDCNINGIADECDISCIPAVPCGVPGCGLSADVNGNGVPDECEDCQPNGILDPADIAGPSDDDNFNGIPDECEPNCNGNSLPDDRDIALGNSTDAYGDGIPDECEEDCDNDNISDYTEINLNMPLDIDRNARLDACQDCDADSLTDLVELAGANNVWVASGLDNSPVRQFFASTGVLMTTSGASIRAGQDVIFFPPSSSFLVTSAVDDSVKRVVGVTVTTLVPSGSGFLNHPTGITRHPDGSSILVSSRDTNNVVRYNGTTGALLGVFVAVGSGGLSAPFGLTFGPNGNLFVTSATNEVMEYNGGTGAFVRNFVTSASNGGLSQPRGLTFKADGNLLVASYGTDEILEFRGLDGAPVGKWAKVGTATAITQDSPWGIRVGPNGHVYVTRTDTEFSSTPTGSVADVGESHLTDARMFEYNVCTGNHRRTHIGGNDHGLVFASGFDFAPRSGDCNWNQLPDNCDITSGASADVNANGIPDECEIDCNANSRPDRSDLIPFGTSRDCNCNFVPDECDIASGEPDVNGDGVPDACQGSCCIPCAGCVNTTEFSCNGRGGTYVGGRTCGSAGACQVSCGVPSNDNCAQAMPLPSVVQQTVFFDNNLATPDGPATVCAQPFGTDLWYNYVAPCNGDMTVSLCGLATLDSMLAVYGGGPTCQCPVGGAPLIVCDDDTCGIGGGPSVVTLPVTAGRCYKIRLGGWNGATGTGQMNVTVQGALCVDPPPPPPQPASHPAQMRMVSFATTPSEGQVAVGPGSVAVRLTLVDLPGAFASWNGQRLWVGAPALVCEAAGTGPGEACPPGLPATARFARFQCGQHCRSDWGTLGTVHVYHESIVPDGMYLLEAINCADDPTDETRYSEPPLVVTTPRWGDCCGPFQGGWTGPDGDVDVTTDVVAVLEKFSNRPSAPIKARADVNGDFDPRVNLDLKINFSDVVRVLDAFRNLPYPFLPSAATPCG